MKASLIAACMVSALLVGCASEDRVSITTRPIEIEVARTADPTAVQMLPVNFRVITRDTVDSFVAEISRAQGQSPVFVAIMMKDYENLSLNLADLRRYIEQQQSIIAYYRQMTSRLPTTSPRPQN
jgi:type IV pilus biogenesis protein CpaD/CtpE